MSRIQENMHILRLKRDHFLAIWPWRVHCTSNVPDNDAMFHSIFQGFV